MNINNHASTPAVDESDLSLKKLDEYHSQLQELQKEKVSILYGCTMITLTDMTVTFANTSISLMIVTWLLCLQSERLQKVLEFVSTVHDLCAVLGMDFFTTVTEVHPSLNDSTSVQSKSISNDTLSRLAKTVLALKEDKKQRLHKVTCLVLILKTILFMVPLFISPCFKLFLLGIPPYVLLDVMTSRLLYCLCMLRCLEF